jgi:cytochrome P450
MAASHDRRGARRPGHDSEGKGIYMATDAATRHAPFDLRLPEFRDDPYPHYERMRREDPVHRGALGELMLTRYADVAFALTDPRFSNDVRTTELHRKRLAALGERAAELDSTFSMIGMDPPDHTRLRRLVQKAFTPRAIERLRPRIDGLVDELLDAVEPDGEMELVGQFAFPLPVTVICEFLGVPTSDQALFHDLTQKMLDDELSMDEQAMIERAFEARMELQRYMRDLAAERRADPRDDLMSALVAVEAAGDQLDERELEETAMLLLIAGHVTTVNLIANGTLALLRHPDEARRLREDPGIARHAVEELLRYDGPVHAVSRAVTEDLELHGVSIRRGELVMAQVASANRDPERFAEPDRLDFDRPDNRHLAFGKGIHFCLGAPLARMEGQIAIPALLRRFADLELATDRPRWGGSFLRGLEELRLVF